MLTLAVSVLPHLQFSSFGLHRGKKWYVMTHSFFWRGHSSLLRHDPPSSCLYQTRNKIRRHLDQVVIMVLRIPAYTTAIMEANYTSCKASWGLTSLDKQTVLFSPPRQLEPLPTTAITQGFHHIKGLRVSTVLLISPFTPSNLLSSPFMLSPPIFYFMGLGLVWRLKYWGPLLASQFFTFLQPLFLPSFLPFSGLGVHILKGEPLPKLMSKSNNEGRLA